MYVELLSFFIIFFKRITVELYMDFASLMKSQMKSLCGYLLIMLIAIPYKSFSYPQSFRVWSNVLYSTHFSSNPDWLYGFLLEGRFKDQPGLFYQGLIQGQLGYQLSNTTQAWMGYTIIPNTLVEPTGRVSHTTHRIYQQINKDLVTNSNHVLFSRSRIEERHRIGAHGIEIVYRQLLNLSIPKWSFHDKYTPLVSDEVFINFNKPVWNNQKPFNQNRFMAGWLFPCGKHNCQVAYLNQFLVLKYNKEINHALFLSLLL